MSDAGLKSLVEEELEFEPAVNAAHIGVAVRDGVVTLTGHVVSYAEKVAAEQATQRRASTPTFERRARNAHGSVDQRRLLLDGLPVCIGPEQRRDDSAELFAIFAHDRTTGRVGWPGPGPAGAGPAGPTAAGSARLPGAARAATADRGSLSPLRCREQRVVAVLQQVRACPSWSDVARRRGSEK